MARDQRSSLDFLGVGRCLNLPDPLTAQEPATKAYADTLIEGLAWKDNVRVATQSNINLAAPGATIDGVTMVSGDRFLARVQTLGQETGGYIWNGAATPATRSPDMNAATELKQAVVTVDEGTSAGVTFRQTVTAITLGTTPLTWVVFPVGATAASETTAGIAEIATQAETDAGVDDARMVTPLKLASWSLRNRKFEADIGDGSATQYDVTHNFGTRGVIARVYRNSGAFDDVDVDISRPSINAVRINFLVAPTSNQFHVVVEG